MFGGGREGERETAWDAHKALGTPTRIVDGVSASSPAERVHPAREAAVPAVMHDVAVGRRDDSEGLQGGRREGGETADRPDGQAGGHAHT